MSNDKTSPNTSQLDKSKTNSNQQNLLNNVVSSSSFANVLATLYWPFLRVKIFEEMHNKYLPLPKTSYKLHIGNGNINDVSINIIEITKAEIVKMPAKNNKLPNKDPVLKWNENDVANWIGTIGWGGIWNRYQALIRGEKITGVVISVITLKDLEEIGIKTLHAKIILRSRDKLLNIAPKSIDNDLKTWDELNEFDLSGAISNFAEVLNSKKFENPLITWPVQLTSEWVRQLGNKNDEEWEKISKIIIKEKIDGRTLKEALPNDLIDFGIDKHYALVIIKAREEVMKNQKPVDIDLSKFDDDAKNEFIDKSGIVDNNNEIDVGVFEVKVQLKGNVSLKTELVEADILPDSKIEIKKINIINDVKIQVDMLNGQILISYLKAPNIEADVEIEISKLNIPLLGEDKWFPQILSAYLFEQYNDANPIQFNFDLV